jgi:hypothetical protein
MSAYDAGTRAVAAVLGVCAALLLALSGHVAAGIDRAEAPAFLIVALSLVSLALAALAVLVPGLWRLACLALASLPLLWVVSVVASTA